MSDADMSALVRLSSKTLCLDVSMWMVIPCSFFCICISQWCIAHWLYISKCPAIALQRCPIRLIKVYKRFTQVLSENSKWGQVKFDFWNYVKILNMLRVMWPPDSTGQTAPLESPSRVNHSFVIVIRWWWFIKPATFWRRTDLSTVRSQSY